jgi:hypothetical protein
VEVKSSFRELDLGLAAMAILPILATYLVRALRWRTLLTPMGQPSLRNLFAATVVGFSSIFIFGRVGEVARPVMLSLRERIRPSATIATIMIERLYDSTAVTLLFAINLIFVQQVMDNPQLTTVRHIGFGLLIALGLGIAGLSLFRWHADSVLTVLGTNLSWLPKKIYRVLVNLLRHLAEGLYVLHDVRGLLVTVGYTTLLWALVTVSFWLLVRAFGLSLPLLSIIFVMGFSLVGSLVPTPGGSAGAFHTTTMVGLILLGIEQNKAASIAIAMHVVAFGSALIFGIYFFLRDGISFKNLRAIMADEMVSLHGTAEGAAEVDAQAIGAKP